MSQQKRRWKHSHVPCEPAPDSTESELWIRNATESPLLRLPPEIRNRIYALVLAVGQIHIRYRPWRHRKKGAARGTGSNDAAGSFYAVALHGEDAWSKSTKKNKAGTPAGASVGVPTLSSVCRQLYCETAALPFCLNMWSFENSRIMERYLLREKRLTLLQRRAIGVLVVSDDLPSRAMERYLGGLRAVVWRDGKTLQRWELASAAELARLVERTGGGRATGASARLRNGWHLYE